ncbi:hypothetical protein RR46_00018 [Papilio xuthus]|uniref:Uncharacterized protein n=1 Tax=Papilio xuthus TaxID=66420 RepID=A0A0N0PF30_PAPXU|nr:hypothetical protein RR46_00018 [Papilio xuthus]
MCFFFVATCVSLDIVDKQTSLGHMLHPTVARLVESGDGVRRDAFFKPNLGVDVISSFSTPLQIDRNIRPLNPARRTSCFGCLKLGSTREGTTYSLPGTSSQLGDR